MYIDVAIAMYIKVARMKRKNPFVLDHKVCSYKVCSYCYCIIYYTCIVMS